MKSSLKILFGLVLWVFCFNSLFSQGTISGTILDGDLGETLIGANVVVENTTTGTSTDFDGKYQFPLDAGTYNIVVSYLGFADKKVEGVEIKDGEVTYLDVTMSSEGVDLGVEVVVEAKAIERSENAVLMLQKKSDKIQDGISAQEISRLGAGNAASALKKVTGTTVVDGKYIVVRGLGDRYSSTAINGIRLPSIDPYRNSAQLDLIPSNLLDNIIASKSFTPDQPGDFTGGSIDVKTKSLPERFTFNISVSGSYNTQATFEDRFSTFEAGNSSWLGFNDGTLDLPSSIANASDEDLSRILNRTAAARAVTNSEIANELDLYANSFNNQFAASEMTAPMDHSLSMSLGNQFRLGSMPLGFLMTVNYSRDYSFFQNGVNNFFVFPGGTATRLIDRYALNETISTERPQLGGMIGFSLKPNGNNEISLMTLYSHQTEISSRYLNGDYRDYDVLSPDFFESRTLGFLERSFIDYIAQGTHVIPSLNNLRVEWTGSYINSSQDEPDLRFFANSDFVSEDRVSIDASNYNEPSHFFRELDDETLQGKLDLTLPFLQQANKGNKLKFGGYFSQMERDFTELIYTYSNSRGQRFNGDIDAYFDESNLGVIASEGGFNTIGLYVVDQTNADNSYMGNFDIWATYGMFTLNLTPKLKSIFGARIEGTEITVDAFDESDNVDISETDFLPALHLVYAVTENANLRATYTNTIARPNLREVAAFGSFGAIGEPIVFGNPDLVLTSIDNFDLRYEVFPRAGEMYAISGFYKNFENPIVQTFRPAGNAQFTWKNTNSATLYGAELEFRKNLAFISPRLDKFSASANFAYIYSESDLDSLELANVRDVDPNFEDTRPFAGQSPFVVNFNIIYSDFENGWDGALAFNYFDDRLAVAGVEGTPDVYEKGRGTLDFTISKTIGRVSLKLQAKNLLNPDFETNNEFLGREYIYTRNRRGRDFSFGISYGI